MPDKHLQEGRRAGTPGLDAALLSGGDERIAVDPRSGRNPYGVPPLPSDRDVWFASTTASPISPRSRAAAQTAFERLLVGWPAEAWTDGLQGRIRQHVGVPGAEVILTGSGTEAELVLLALAGELLGPAITNIVTSPEETGSGVPLAADGRNFLHTASCAKQVTRGERLAGWTKDIAAEGVAIRCLDGKVLPGAAVDAAVSERVAAAIRSGRDAIVHCLDASKTGLSGLSRAAAAALAADHPGRVLVAVDACQMRCPVETIREDLLADRFVLITGSKFLGGPAFAGALLVPPSAVDQLRRITIPSGMAAYSARHDWPATLLDRMGPCPFSATTNVGLGLRWEAALAEWDNLAAQPDALRRIATSHLGTVIRRAIAGSPGLHPLQAGEGASRHPPTIFPVITTAPNGEALCAVTLHRALQRPAGHLAGSGRAFHVGQPVTVGRGRALRIAISAAHVAQVAAGLAAGETLDEATRPIAADLDELMTRWVALRATLAPLRQSA